MKNHSHTTTTEVDIPKWGANGVFPAQVGRFGGWSLYLKDNGKKVAAAQRRRGRGSSSPERSPA
jgi:hypothetical protein